MEPRISIKYLKTLFTSNSSAIKHAKDAKHSFILITTCGLIQHCSIELGKIFYFNP